MSLHALVVKGSWAYTVGLFALSSTDYRSGLQPDNRVALASEPVKAKKRVHLLALSRLAKVLPWLPFK